MPACRLVDWGGNNESLELIACAGGVPEGYASETGLWAGSNFDDVRFLRAAIPPDISVGFC